MGVHRATGNEGAQYAPSIEGNGVDIQMKTCREWRGPHEKPPEWGEGERQKPRNGVGGWNGVPTEPLGGRGAHRGPGMGGRWGMEEHSRTPGMGEACRTPGIGVVGGVVGHGTPGLKEWHAPPKASGRG